ncbi:MAG: family 78 glycoside hydrolase catalytic domain [Fimbriimonadia bacterium]|nr:family 78 glycoside hydrolase catalytic domain [Fimbriimonadia bacterium]
MNWQAKWIWSPGEEAPRNFYWCVRKEVELKRGFKQLSIALSADTRYALWCNGTYVGQGPIRSFHGNWSYDIYDLTELARNGLNAIAIVVQHHGLSTFQYDLQRGKGRGGLIAQVECDGKVVAASDRTWLNLPHPRFNRRATRMSCQLGFSEICDSRALREDWTLPAFDDYEWNEAVEIGEASCAPWGELSLRSIPYLTYEPISPTRILRAQVVRPPAQTWSFDLKPTLAPGDLSANPRSLSGIAAVALKIQESVEINLLYEHHGFREGDVRLNGEPVPLKNGIATFKASPGEHLLTCNVSRWYHDWMYYLVLDTANPTAIQLKNPLDEKADYPWVTVGPFDGDSDGFEKAWSMKTAEAVKSHPLTKPIDLINTAEVDVFALTRRAQPLPEKPRIERVENCLAPAPHSTPLYPPETGDLELLIDFGKETVGFVLLEMSAPEGTQFDFNGFEYLDPLHIDRIQWTSGLSNTFRYISRAGWQKFRSLTRRGFRYATLTIRFPEGVKDPVLLREIRCHQNTYPYSERGEFHCSDSRLNAAWNISRHTIRLCSEDTFVDCPSYEQTFWVGDARNEALFAYTAFGDYTLTRRCLLLAGESLKHSPLVESQVPSGWENILTAWALLWTIACHEHYLYSGDNSFLEQIYIRLAVQNRNLHEKYLNDKGLLDIRAWNMLDWAPMDTPGEGVVTHQNMWLALAYERSAQVANWLGQTEDAQTWRQWAQDLKTAIQTHLWNESKQAYTDCLKPDGSQSPVFSQQTQVVAYLCGIVPKEKESLFTGSAGKAGYLQDPPEGFVRIGSPFAMAFQLEALALANDQKRILELIRTWWGLMLDQDATTCWETFPGRVPKSPMEAEQIGWFTRSHCHAWSAAPAFALPAYVLGVQPLEPGFKTFAVKPFLGDLQWAHGRVPTPFGEIQIALVKQKEGIALQIQVPENSSAVIEGKSYPAGRHQLTLPHG